MFRQNMERTWKQSMVLQTRSVIQISEKTALQTNKNPERFFSLPPPFLGPITYHRSRERVFIVRRLFRGLVRYCFFRGSRWKLPSTSVQETVLLARNFTKIPRESLWLPMNTAWRTRRPHALHQDRPSNWRTIVA